jgi:AcrR family transcriptional regulator
MQDGRRARGAATHEEILTAAMGLASVEGLEQLSTGRLATLLGVSKSGVFAHFGSKERLQLAVISAAVEVFTGEVVAPALATPPGMRRLRRLVDGWLDYAQRRVFPGGCFFFAAGAEFDARPGAVRTALAAARRDWLRLYVQTIRDAQQLGELGTDTDPEQLAFELDAFGAAANAAGLLLDDAAAYRRARVACHARLSDAAATVQGRRRSVSAFSELAATTSRRGIPPGATPSRAPG